MKIESLDQDIRNILTSGYYRIPRFQRPYSWDRENIQEFWDDIIRDGLSDYFIGSMVVFKDGNQRYGVVDGQQRLTTITILLCVIRNKLSELGFDDLARGIHTLIERPNIDNKSEFVVSTESSYPYFQDHIQKWGDPELTTNPLNEEQNLRSAFAQLKSLVSDAIDSIKKDTTLSETQKSEASRKKLVGVRDALLAVKVILVKLEEEDDAYVIFETLNTRGKDLSLSDLVKNHLTKNLKATNSSVDQTKIKWGRLLETIESSSLELDTDTFIHHYWLSRYDYIPAKNLYKTIRKRMGNGQAASFLDSLVEDAALYRSMYEIPYGKWTKQERPISDALTALTIFRVQQEAPCVLSLLREYRITKKLKMRHIEDALVAIEKFHFVFTAITSQRSSGGISAMYASLGRRLFESKNSHDATQVISELKQKLRDRIPDLDEFKALFPNLMYTDNFTKQKKLVRYTLTGLDRLLPNAMAVDYEQLTIEHLAPQSSIGSAGFPDEIVGQLGNLLFVGEELNGQLKNKPFKEKKKILQDAGYMLPEEIESSEVWGPEQIKARTQSLASKAYHEAWKI